MTIKIPNLKLAKVQLKRKKCILANLATDYDPINQSLKKQKEPHHICHWKTKQKLLNNDKEALPPSLTCFV